MGFFSFLFSGIGALFGAVTEIVSDVVSAVSSVMSLGKSSKTIKTVKEQVSQQQEDIHVLNDEIIYLRKKFKQNGSLNSQEQKRLLGLQEERDFVKEEINKNRKEIAAQKFIENENVNQQIIINNNTTHILQWNAFADTLGKTCPKCGRVMKIQWKRGLEYVSPIDFYWGCSGWYVQNNNISECRYTEKLQPRDFALMADTSAPEFKLSSQDFSVILNDDSTAKLITERIDDLQSDLSKNKQGIDIVCCPIHAEPMILQKKRDAVGLLDQYYLKCPHWSPNGQGCTYIEKLKSGSQLAALLKNQTGRGIL